MRPITLFAAALLTGCTAGIGGGPLNQDTDVDCTAAGPEYVPSTGTFALNELLVNGQAVFVDVDTVGVCRRADGNGAAWTLDAQEVEFGTIIAELNTTGPQDLDQDLVIDLYGASPPVRFTGVDFFSGTWVANTFDPIGISLQGQANNTANNSLNINFTATAN